MSRREVTDCDRCPAQDVVAHRLAIAVGRECDGVAQETHVEYVDLCPACLARELVLFTGKMDADAGKAWVKCVRRRG